MKRILRKLIVLRGHTMYPYDSQYREFCNDL